MKIVLLLSLLISSNAFTEEIFLQNIINNKYISKRGDTYQILSNGNITKNDKVRYKFAGSISTNQAYYKLGAFWAGVQYRDNLLEIFPSFSGKKGVRFDKKSISTLTNIKTQ